MLFSASVAASIPSPSVSSFQLGPLTIHIYALCIIAGCAHAAEIAAVLGGVSLTTFLTGIWL